MDKIVLNEKEQKLYDIAVQSTGMLDADAVLQLYANLSGMSPEAADIYTRVRMKLHQDGVIK